MTLIRDRARILVILGFAAFVAFSLGCMNLSFGGRHEHVTSKTSEASSEGLQRGNAYAPFSQEVTVYYPVPYASPPNLEFEDGSKTHLTITEQRADCFKFKSTHVGAEVAWKARGVLSSSAKAPNANGVTPATFESPQMP